MTWWGDAAGALAYAGVGAAVGSIGAAAITAHSSKGESRAHAADLISNAAGELADHQAAAIERLEKRLDRIVAALQMLTTVDEELLEQVPMPVSERTKLQKAVNAAKQAI